MKPDISVVVPVYNVENHLAECLDSILRQTFQNIEILCVDDGSTDRSPEILAEYTAADPRMIVVRKENGGLSSARNTAYPLLKGDYTLFVDSDDWIEPDLCAKTLAAARREHADMTFFLYRQTGIDDHEYHLESFLKHDDFSAAGPSVLLAHMTAWSKLWRTGFLLENDLRFPEGIYYEDNVAHWKALIRQPKLTVLPEILYRYRRNPSSITRTVSARRFFDIVECYERIETVLREEERYADPWKIPFLRNKLVDLCVRYFDTPRCFRDAMQEKIRSAYGKDEKHYLENDCPDLPVVRAFYGMLDGSVRSKLKYLSLRALRSAKNGVVLSYKLLDSKFRRAG